MPELTKELPKEKSTEKDVRLTFSFPDVITVGHYEIYTNTRLKYVNEQDNPSNLRAQYEGARALIKAGIVHITSDDEGGLFASKLKELILADDQTSTPVNVMGLIGLTVASKVEMEVGASFLFGQSYSISITPPNGTHLKS